MTPDERYTQLLDALGRYYDRHNPACIATADQRAAAIRTGFAKMGVDVDDGAQSRAALIGFDLALQLIGPHEVLVRHHLESASHKLHEHGLALYSLARPSPATT